MAGSTPFFLTGGNALILMDGQTVAFATNVSYRVVVKHASPRVLGRYEVENLHPLQYDVFGAFTVIRYASKLKKKLNSSSPDVSEKGNSIGSYDSPVANVNEALNPGRLLTSKMFDIEIRQQSIDEPVHFFTLRDCRIDEIAFNVDKRGAATQTIRFTARYLDDDVFVASKSGDGQENT